MTLHAGGGCSLERRMPPFSGGVSMPYRRLWTSGVLGLAVVLVATSNEALSKTIRVTADITQTITLGAQDALGDSDIANADLSDHSGHQVGTLTAHCTIISITPRDTLEQCLLTA